MEIVFIGSGNIASHLAKAFHANGNIIRQIYSRTLAHAQTLARDVNAAPTDSLKHLVPDADLYIIAVADDAIPSVIRQLPKTLKGIVVHTSGATSLDILQEFQHFGVIYPPQSINKHIDTDFSKIPFGVEANTEENLRLLFNTLKSIAPKTFACNSQQRLALHVAAVIANNFSNALFQMTYDILQHEQLDFELLKPIILETAHKVQYHPPYETQTGPARRGDYKVIDKHLEFLSQQPEERKIYQLLTDFIIKRYQK